MAKPLILESSHLSLFGAFWWMVLAITITQRGKQAAAAGLGGGSARDATMAFAWLEMVLFLANSAAVIVDRWGGVLRRAGDCLVGALKQGPAHAGLHRG